ncbi:porin [Massilia sp. 9I]|uniref:porin n=1 Tax=Massilia sp. 9I TaxID=2653152 RepID=UPI0012F1E638|nr:porin [Massilia sp. 9I]VXC03091.1 Gram-negative porin family protein [Massilia sp. 9I]
MNKTARMVLVLAGSAGLVPTLAQAQTNITIYGIVDAAIVGERGGAEGSLTKMTGGAGATSRIGFKGSEDLGGGLSAFFTLETGIRLDTGATDVAGSIFNRQALVGLKGGFGAVALGRQYTPYHNMLVQVVDPFNTGYAGTAKNLFPHSGSNIRTSNTITWASPNMHGVDMELAYSAGEQSDSAARRQFGGAIGYASGPLTLRVAYNSKNGDAATRFARSRNTLLGAQYKLGKLTLHAGFGIDRGPEASPLANPNNPYGGVPATPSTDGRELLLGLSAALGQGKLMASVMHKDDRSAFNQDASGWGIGYLYSLSKRTGVYAAYAHVSNRNGAGYTVNNNTEAGSGNTGYNLGLRHSF